MSAFIKDLSHPFSFNRSAEDEYSKNIASFINFCQSMSQLTYQSICLVDYQQQSFLYVSDNPLFLCGRTPNEVMRRGWPFYLKYVPEEDQKMLHTINRAGASFFSSIPPEDRLKYFISYDFHLKQPSGNLALINHKLKPVLLDRHFQPSILLCLVSVSPNSTAGNFHFKSVELQKCYDYHFGTSQWNESQDVKLNKREKDILILSSQGYTMTQISSKLFVSTDTVKFHKKKIFNKLGVRKIPEAISTAIVKTLL